MGWLSRPGTVYGGEEIAAKPQRRSVVPASPQSSLYPKPEVPSEVRSPPKSEVLSEVRSPPKSEVPFEVLSNEKLGPWKSRKSVMNRI